MVSFVHFADLHVDHYQRGKRGKDFAVRVYDMLGHLNTIFDFAIANKVDFVLFAGDMYHTHLPKQEIRTAVHACILRLVDAGIPFYGVPGNHDMIKRDSSKDALYELTSLRVPGVHIFHTPGVVDCGAYAVAGIPWMYADFDTKTLALPDKPTFAAVHATILGAVYGSGRDTSELFLGREFVLQLQDLTAFDYVGLGHIHRPQILYDNPYIIYPGSVGWHSWGEIKDGPHNFVHYKDGEIELIPFEDRPRYAYTLSDDDKVPDVLDPEAFYRFTLPPAYPVTEINVKYRNVYSLELNIVRERVERRIEDLPNMDRISEKEQLRIWFEYTDQDFSEVEALFDEIVDANT